MANLNYYLVDVNSLNTPIYLRIQSKNQSIKFYVGIIICPKHWDKEKQIVRRSRIDSPELNLKLLKIKNETNRLISIHYDLKQVRNELKELFEISNKPKEHINTITDLAAFEPLYMKLLAKSKGQTKNTSITNSTIIASQQTFRIIKNFSKLTGNSILFENINLDFHNNLLEYFQQIKKYSNNTIAKHINRLKTFLNVATELGYNNNMAYKSKRFTASKEEVQNIYLTEFELGSMFKLNLSNKPHLERVRDLFVIGAYTGLRFSDFTNLKQAVFSNINNQQFFELKTQKTKQQIVIPVLDIVNKIFKKYTTEGVLQLPRAISNQKMNQYLKEIGQLIPSLIDTFTKNKTKGGMNVKINKPKWELLTTHTARRSFATNMYLRGIDVPRIKDITGHKTESSFYTYIQMTPSQKAISFFEQYQSTEPKSKIVNK